jgi:transcriptional antiterminator RfaH
MNSTSNISCSSDPWYVVHCKPRKESYAASVLKNHLGLFIFLPESRIRVRGELRQVPFFPGYLFAQANLQKVPPSHINSCPGVLRLVGFGGDPQPVPLLVIETISEEISRLNTMGSAPYHGFSPGDSVRVKQGPLQDLEMVFVGPTSPSKRVRVLLNFLGRLKEVYVHADALEKIARPQTINANDLPHGRAEGLIA